MILKDGIDMFLRNFGFDQATWIYIREDKIRSYLSVGKEELLY
jgi:hypothetical protein